MTGDSDDLLYRLRRLVPPWFGTPAAAVVVDAMLAGAAAVLSFFYAIYAYAKLQTRLATMTDGWLDFAAGDFFGKFMRFSGEQDPGYGRRIRLEVFRDRNTRHGIDRQVFDLYGLHPEVFEAWRPGCCGGYGLGGLGYGVVGRYGCENAPAEVIIVMPEPQNYGIPNRGGWGSGTGGYGIGNFSYVDDQDIIGSGPTQADLFAALDGVRTAAVDYFVRFTRVGDPVE